MVQRAVMLGVTRVVDLADWADVPLTVDMNVFKVVAFEACLSIARVVVRKRGINRYTMNGSSSNNFVAKFSALEYQHGFDREQ